MQLIGEQAETDSLPIKNRVIWQAVIGMACFEGVHGKNVYGRAYRQRLAIGNLTVNGTAQVSGFASGMAKY